MAKKTKRPVKKAKAKVKTAKTKTKAMAARPRGKAAPKRRVKRKTLRDGDLRSGAGKSRAMDDFDIHTEGDAKANRNDGSDGWARDTDKSKGDKHTKDHQHKGGGDSGDR